MSVSLIIAASFFITIFMFTYSDDSTMKKMLRFLLSVACIADIAGEVRAQYVSSGPNGGTVYSFYRDNTSVFAAGSGGVYQSGNDGRTWRDLSAAPSVFGCDLIYSVASSGGDVYAGSQQSGIFHSSDGGATWINASTGLRIARGAPYTDIEIAGPNVLAIRSDSGFLFMSTDQGMHWLRINPVIANAVAQYLSIHNGDVYVSTFQGLFKSTNNGVNFMNIDPMPTDFGKLVWVGDTAYAATSTGVKMSLDGGNSFTTVGLSGRAVRSVAASGNNMYAVVRNPAPVQDSVLYSSDGGVSFSAAPFAAGTFRFTAVNDLAITSAGVLVGSNYSIYGTTNNGSSWGLSDSGYNATSIRGLAIAGAYVVSAAAPMGVYRVKPDSGALAWQHSGDVADGIDGNVQCIAAKGGFVHLGSASGYYRSADSGSTWTAGATGSSGGNVTSIYADPSKSDIWMIRNGNLYYSSDDGGSFGQVVNSNIPPGVGQLVTRADSAVFVASLSALYKGGSTMSFSTVTGLSGFVTAVVFAANTYYAATSGSGLYSSSNGASWTAVNIPLPGMLPSKINTLIADSAGTSLIAGTEDGFYTNAGGVWARAGLAGHVVLSLVLRGGKLFVGTCSGVYSVPYKIIIPPPVVSVGNSIKPAFSAIETWPNPARDNFSLRVQCLKSCDGRLVVRDMMGAIVLQSSVSLKAGTNELHVDAKHQALAPGIYIVQISGDVLRTARVMLY